MHRKTFWLSLPAALLSTLLISQVVRLSQRARADDAVQAETKLAPVDKSMHEFMEYFFQPTYLRLKPSVAASAAANPSWGAIKSDALILAEGGNLLLLRTPLRDPAKWNEYSVAVRDSAGQLYKAARKKDFDACRKTYEQMLTNCNRCHKQFAGGKHILAP
ncbi:MAG TPA: cytochrome c [Planctomycetaceae bacterium]|nr:cytochrome c [Planctomycetaceae bacterium]